MILKFLTPSTGKSIFFINHPIPRWDSISRPIAPISSVAGGDDDAWTRRQGNNVYVKWYIWSSYSASCFALRENFAH
jgi:hypothetical protein